MSGADPATRGDALRGAAPTTPGDAWRAADPATRGDAWRAADEAAPGELTIRRARGDELPALKALIESAYRGQSAQRGWTNEAHLLTGERITAPALAAHVAAPDIRILVAEGAQGALIATMSVAAPANPGAPAYLSMLAVSPDIQSTGLGRRMIAATEAAAVAAWGAKATEMTVISSRHELIAFYQRRGYRLTGEIRPFPVTEREGTGLEMVVLTRSLG